MVSSHWEAAQLTAEPGDGPEPLETSAVFRFQRKTFGGSTLGTVYDSDWSQATPVERPPLYGLWVLEGIRVVDEEDGDPIITGTWRPATEDDCDEEPDFAAIEGVVRRFEADVAGAPGVEWFSSRKAMLVILREIDDVLDDAAVPPAYRRRLETCWTALAGRLVDEFEVTV